MAVVKDRKGPDEEFPCSLIVHVPFPTHHLASAALHSLAVDEELSLLVQRSFALVAPLTNNAAANDSTGDHGASALTIDNSSVTVLDGQKLVLQTHYRAATNRMLRVAVNGFFESLGVIVQVMEELDVDVLHEKGLDSLEGVQGVEQGLTGTTNAGARMSQG